MEKLFVAWILAFITSYSPPGRPTYVPEAKETKEEAEARYESIARDLVTVVSEEEPLFKGPQGRIKTAAVMLSIMFHESGFRKDVDLGVGKVARGDSGRSVCLMQLNLGAGRTLTWNTKKNRPPAYGDDPGDIVQGWTPAEVLADRKKCFRAGYRVIKVSFASGSSLPATEWLRVYASGKTNEGSKESRSRMGLALKYFGEHKPDFKDVDFLAPAKPEPVPVYVEPLIESPVWGMKPAIRSFVLPGY